MRDLPRCSPAATGPVEWRGVSADDAPAAWAALRDWVDWFRQEFAFDHRLVPPCWYQHRAMVSVLSALHGHWICAYDSLNAASGASEWHRALVQLEPRLREWAARTGCTVGAHRPDVIVNYPDNPAAWNAHIEADVAEATSATRTTAATDPADSLPLVAWMTRSWPHRSN